MLAERGKWLHLPPYQAGTITSVASYDATEALTSADYDVNADDTHYLYNDDAWTHKRYRVTAKWGYGTPPAALVEVALQVAVNLWRSKDRGLYTDVIGVEAGPGGGTVVGYQGALTNQQKLVIAAIRGDYRERII